MKIPALPLLLTLLTAATAPAVQTERVRIDSFAEWAEGEARGVAVEEPGRLTPGSAFTRSANLDVPLVWSGALAPNGDLVVGTGDKGQVWRIRANGNAELLTTFSEPEVYAVAVGPKGEIYAAPSPGGKIFRLGAGGKFEEYFATGETYVWDLKVATNGTLYAATGTKGRLYRITAAGQGGVWFDADEPHLRRLLLEADGSIAAGSAGQGLVYRITAKDRGVVLLDSGKDEITALAADAEGVLYAAAVSNPGESGPSDRPRSVRIVAAGDGGTNVVVESGPPRSNGGGASSPPSSGPSRAACDLYAIRKDLYPQRVRELKDDLLSLAVAGGRVLAGSGTDGRLYQLTDGKAFAMLGRIDAGPVAGIFASGSRVRLLTGGPAAVWDASAAPASGARYLSKAVDSKLFARWGALRLCGEGDWQIRTRSGNTANPDKSWHAWSPLEGDKVASPAARYLQFEVTLARGHVEQAEVFFLPQNQPPRVENLKLLDPDVAYEPIQQPAPPPQPQAGEQLAKGGEGPPQPPVRFQPVSVRGARTAAWMGLDANGDRLEYTVHLRKEGEAVWELLESRIEHPVFSWDTSGWPDGTYRLRVTATDAPDNAAPDALQAERVSETFTIDQTAPTLNVRRKTTAFVEIEAADATSPIAAAYMSTNGHDFEPLLPEDGIADSKREVFRADFTPGKSLFLRVEDAHGNVTGWRQAAGTE